MNKTNEVYNVNNTSNKNSYFEYNLTMFCFTSQCNLLSTKVVSYKNIFKKQLNAICICISRAKM